MIKMTLGDPTSVRTTSLARHALITFILLVWVFGADLVAAQQGPHPWLLPENISKSGVATLPQIAADFEGRVHVVWGEPSSEGIDVPPDAIMYTRLEDGVWSQPIDIVSAGAGNLSAPVDLQVDPYGSLALVWHSNDTLYLSKAAPENAGLAPGWQTTVVDSVAANSASLAFDELGTYYLAYVRDSREIVLSKSSDAGMSWLNNITVAVAESNDQAFIDPALALHGGQAFLAWTRNLRSENWGPAGVWFSRSEDAGLTWASPQELVPGQGFGWSHLLADPDGRLHFSWIGSLKAGGRYYRWSDDGGLTWSPTDVIATPEQLRGFAGRATLLMDSAERLHTVFGGLGLGRPDSIWYSVKQGQTQDWTLPLAISDDSPDSQGALAALSQGHVIHVAWLDYGTRDISYSAYDTGAPKTVRTPLPIPVSESVPVRPTARPTRMAQTAINPLVPDPTPLGTSLPASPAPEQRMSDSAMIITSVAAPLVLVLTVVVSVLLRQRRVRGR